MGGKAVEKWKKDYLKGILRDYPKMEDYYLERKEKLRFSGGACTKQPDISSQGNGRFITISQDRRLINLERNQKIISCCLANATAETRKIIELLYMTRREKTNLDLVADHVFLSKRQVIRLRDAFFEELADQLGI